MFEIFEKGAIKPDLVPEVTVLKKKSLYLNAPARKLIQDPGFVELLFDRERQIIGIKPSGAANPNSYKLSQATDTSWSISLVAFARFYELEFSESRKRIASLEGNVLCVNLRDEGLPVGRRSSG